MKDWKIRFILFTSIFYFNACTFINRRFYTDPFFSFEEALKRAPYDALVVPGFPHIKDNMTKVVQNRVIWAWYLYSKGLVKNIIFSGGAVYSPYYEAGIMALYAQQLGIPAENIYTETQAEHSTENLYYSYKIAEQKGFTRVAVATDPSQSTFMNNINNRRFNIPVDFIPIVSKTLKQIPRIKPHINQDVAFVSNFVSIIDREGVWKRLRGTQGCKVEEMMQADKNENNSQNLKT